MMAAGQAAMTGAKAVLLEKTDRLGKKVAISGKGRCNITNAADVATIIKQFPGNGNFLYGPLYTFDNQALVEFLAQRGVATKVERGQRVFPVSDDAEQIVDAFKQFLRQTGVEIRTQAQVNKILRQEQQITGVRLTSGEIVPGKAVIICTGGLSYPATGSTGDGYHWAQELGHTVIPTRPALVPLVSAESWVKQLQGLALRNVQLTAWRGSKVLDTQFGEMLFAHFGITGPIVLSISRAVVDELARAKQHVLVTLDLKPALSGEQLDARLQRDFTALARKQFKNSLQDLLPKNLIPVIIDLSQIPPEKEVHQITREERLHLGRLLKRLPMTIIKSLPIAAAIVTAGGVSVKEINPKTLESKLCQGLFFAGEVIDVDAYTGGYNLQAAFSTGYLAGKSAAIGSSEH